MRNHHHHCSVMKAIILSEKEYFQNNLGVIYLSFGGLPHCSLVSGAGDPKSRVRDALDPRLLKVDKDSYIGGRAPAADLNYTSSENTFIK